MFRQFLTLSAGEGIARGLHALAFLLLARQVGPVALGEFGVAQALAAYGVLAVLRGLDTPAMLRVLRDPKRVDALRVAMVRLRLPVFAVLIFATAIWRNPLLLAMAGMWLAAALQMRWLLVARQQSAVVAVGALASSAIFLAGVALRLPLVWVAGTLSVGELTAAAWYWFTAGKTKGAADRMDAELQRESWPYLGSLLAGNLLFNLDVFVLDAIKGPAEVGLYLAAYRLITVLSPVLSALQISSLPMFGNLYPDGPAAARLAFRLAIRAAGVAACIAAVLALTPTILLPLLYGHSFAGAAVLVPLFAVTLVPQVVRMVYRQSLLAFGGGRTDLHNLLVALSVNGVIDLMLVPRTGALGAAIATLATECCFAALTWRACRRLGCA